MISRRRAQEILQYFEENGKSKTLLKYGIKKESLARYVRILKYDQTKNPKVLLLDVETSFMDVKTFSLFNQSPLSYLMIQKPWFMISWSAKWLYSPTTFGDVVTPEEALKRDDSRIVKKLWGILHEANIVIGHNIDKFDKRVIGSRFMHYQLPPPGAYRTIDTYKTMRSMFREPSNRLDYAAYTLFGKGKIKTDYSLWIECEKGNQEALSKMFEYNKNDVVILEDLYLWIRPWIRNHPNLGLLLESKVPVCRYCGSQNIHEDGEYITPQNRYILYRCEDCGALSAFNKSNLSRDEQGNKMKNAPI